MDGLFDELGTVTDRPAPEASFEKEPEAGPRAKRPARAPGGSMRRFRIPAVTLGILAVVAFPAYKVVSNLTQPPASERAAKAVADGLDAHHAGRLQEAASSYREALRLEPLNKFAHYNLGLLAQTNGDRATAEREYRLTLAIDPEFLTAIYNLAIIRAEAGSTNEAVELYQRIIALDPKNAAAHLNLGFMFDRLGMRPKAEAEFAAAIRLDPKLADRLPKNAR